MMEWVHAALDELRASKAAHGTLLGELEIVRDAAVEEYQHAHERMEQLLAVEDALSALVLPLDATRVPL